MFRSFKYTLSVFTVFSVLVSCSRDVGTEKIKIELPQNISSKVSSQSVAKLSTPFGKGSESSLANINCYMVVVAGPDEFFKRNSCKTSTGIEYKFGNIRTGIDATGSSPGVDLAVPSGPDREVILLGINADAGYCRQVIDDPSVLNNWTKPRILARSGKLDLQGGEQSAYLKLPASDDLTTLATPEIEDCQINGRNHNSGPILANSLLESFGDGSDGDVVLSGSFYDFSTLDLNSVGGSRAVIAAASMKVISVDTDDGKTLTLDQNVQTGTPKLLLGDLVFTYVPQAQNDSSCGHPEFFRGRFSVQKVIDVSGVQITLESPLLNASSPFPTPLRAGMGTLLGTTNNPSGAFCRISVTRIPQINTLWINHSGSQTNITGQAFNDGKGGLLPIKIKDKLKIDSSAHGSAVSFYLDMGGKGFSNQSGPTKPGEGIAGIYSSASASIDNGGGGAASTGAGGGSNGGMGADSGGVAGFRVGDLVGVPGVGVPPWGHKKIFLGGQGGLLNSNPGAAGGGIVFASIHEVEMDYAGSNYGNTFKLSSKGEDSAAGSGAGAGGSVMVNVKTVTNNSATRKIISYVPGGTGVAGGGGGGSGVSEFLYCNESDIAAGGPTLQENVTLGTGGTGGDANTLGASNAFGVGGHTLGWASISSNLPGFCF